MSNILGANDWERLIAALWYCPETGVFTRRRNSSHAKAGDVAGCKNRRGYLEFNVLGKLNKAHRVAWLYFYREWPAGDIDHIDGNKANNAIANLRVVSNRTNSENRYRANANNFAGLLGVRIHRRTGRFEARIVVAGKLIYLGLHDTPAIAHAAYVKAKREYHQGGNL